NLLSLGEEPPSMLWGLDPMFNAFNRLYVKDILQMRESCQVAGIYFYKSHPIFEREDFFFDDATGVINSLCWKDEQWRDQGDPATCNSARGKFNPANELKKLRQAQHSSSHLEIGELLRVRARQDLQTTERYNVSDPVMAVQISWMMEVPQLYRHGSASYLLGRPTRILKDFLKEKEITRFRPYDVQDVLQPQEPEAGPSSGTTTSFKQLRELLQKSLQILQDECFVFHKVKSQDEVCHVTERDNDLLMAIRDILREDCRREKCKGISPLLTPFDVRQRYSRNVSKAALELVLKALECNSDIISYFVV
uniref:STN1 subunit of CST complex n=1 Tax=Hucho hucho TaxID=62062 RepID=A0A4W5QGV9_9TELE